MFAGGKDSQLSHPFCAVFSADGHLYVSNQDTNEITYYEGPGMKNPGKVKGVFASGFTTLRGIATDSDYWYVADEGDSSNNIPGAVWFYDTKGNKQPNSLTVTQPVHLLYDASQYLYIGSEQDNAVYKYDTKATGSKPASFITSTKSAPIDHTAGLALSGGTFYVASRKGMAVNQYSIASPAQGTVFVSCLADNPEFVRAAS
ncbi:MAG: hypothetical protein ACRDFW_07930 [bacterium]